MVCGKIEGNPYVIVNGHHTSALSMIRMVRVRGEHIGDTFYVWDSSVF